MQNGLILSPLLTLTKIGPKSLITSSIKDLETILSKTQDVKL